MDQPANADPVRDELEAPQLRKRFRLRWALLAAGVVLMVGWAGFVWYSSHSAEREIEEAVAEADRLDPGWRFADLEAGRAVIPPKEDGAAVVLKSRSLLPTPWPPKSPKVAGLDEFFRRPSHDPVTAQQLQEFRDALTKAAGGLAVARRLEGTPRGRYAIAWSSDFVGTLLPHIDDVRTVNRLLTLDALVRARGGDMAGALASCRAAINVGRSLGDEPCAVSQRVRLACVLTAVRGLEQILAYGEAPAAELEAVQRLLEEEARHPAQLIAARAERAGVHEYLTVVRLGKFNRAAYGMQTSFLGATGDDLIDRARASGCHAEYLRQLTELVEIAKLPPEQQYDRLQKVPAIEARAPVFLEAMYRGEDFRKGAEFFHRGTALLRCAIAATAAERYRLKHGHWPDALTDLVPGFLQAVPPDPMDGKPLRFRRLADGLLIYSVGTDRTDHGGHLDRAQLASPNLDLGFQLWDAEIRR